MKLQKKSLRCREHCTPQTHYTPWSGFLYYNMTTPYLEGNALYTTWGHIEHLCGFEPCETSPVTSTHSSCLLCDIRQTQGTQLLLSTIWNNCIMSKSKIFATNFALTNDNFINQIFFYLTCFFCTINCDFYESYFKSLILISRTGIQIYCSSSVSISISLYNNKFVNSVKFKIQDQHYVLKCN